MNPHLQIIYFKIKHNKKCRFKVFIISLKAAFSLSILARLRSMLQFDFSWIFFERSLTTIRWITFWTYYCVLLSLSLQCFSRSRRFEWTCKFDNRKTKRLLTQIDYPVRLSLFRVICRKRNDTISMIRWIIQINHSVLSQRRYCRLGVVLFTQELANIWDTYHLLTSSIVNDRFNFKSAEKLLSQILTWIHSRDRSLLGPAKLNKSFLSLREEWPRYRRNRTPRDYHLVSNFA